MGIMRTFLGITAAGSTNIAAVAPGVAEALVTTVVGLWIAIPSIVFFQIVRNRLTRLVLEAGVVSGNLMKRFAGVQTSAKKDQ